MKVAVNGQIYNAHPTAGVKKYIAGSGIKIEDNTISVIHPNVFITQAEYDALTEEEKHNGTVYIITDQEDSSNYEAGLGIEIKNKVISAKSVYSLEETCVGTWIDGRPLYRRVFEATLQGTSNVWEVCVSFTEYVTGIMLYGWVRTVSTNEIEMLPATPKNASNTVPTKIEFFPGAGIKVNNVNATYKNCPCIMILYYTKPTDSPEEVTSNGT